MSLTEHELLKKLIAGDVITFEEVFKRYNRRIYIFSYKYLKNREDAEGIVQEVFIKLWENSNKLRTDSNLNAWLFTVTFNAIRKRFRKLAAEKKHVEGYLKIMESRQEYISESESFDLLEKANHLIEKLPSQQKKIILLKRDKGLSCAEMAELLNLSKKTVENHLNRARSSLRKAIMEEGLLSVVVVWMIMF